MKLRDIRFVVFLNILNCFHDFSYPLQVRWADLEERKAQMKMRDIGFVVGQTNWNRMLDPSGGSSALTKTKIIPNRHQSEFKNSK